MGKLPVMGQAGGGEKLRHVAVGRTTRYVGSQAEPDSYTSVNLSFWMPADVEITQSNFKLYVSRGSTNGNGLPSGDQSYYLSAMKLAELGKTELLLPQMGLSSNQSWKLKFAAQAPVISGNSTSALTGSSAREWGADEACTLREVTLTIKMKYWNDVAGGSAAGNIYVTILFQLRIFE